MLPILSIAVLRSAWVEPDAAVRGVMWQPLLTFLKGVTIVYSYCNLELTELCIEFPDAWDLTGADKPDHRDEDESDSEDSEDDETNDILRQSQEAKPITGRSIAYREFLQFLELGCSGSPSQGYPTIVIILSTIPSPVRRKTQNCEYACVDTFDIVNRFLCPSQISSHRFGQQLMAVLSVPSIAQRPLLHFYLPYWSARSSLFGVFGVVPLITLFFWSLIS
jgi:hypothetical protein